MAMKVKTIEDMKAVWKRAGRNGGRKRSERMSAKRRSEIASLGGMALAEKRKSIKNAA